ncbi:CLAVATA3/ESR (CLE)-related protein 12-like [Cornus florida]|uniref:CLAVATA3/ESR (CLE)-related protein 12-like n=1 Tax=Cornus florida TaxID=4283 RepID=UPI0028A24E6C|nr:CLAVATA3/ESR (CLE)-related protein 12-like [Cornus florida]
MAPKITRYSLTIILWISLLFLCFHAWRNFKHDNSKNGHLSDLSHHHDHHTLPTRKALATKFDFTPFMRHHRRHVPVRPGSSEIDPRYGAEMRLVPTGPNPLHH